YNFKPELALLFPWHKYVNVLMPPTYNTWGFGIGFYIHDGVYKYKSFPICPLFMGLMPDFYPTPEGETQWRPEFRDAENENITTYYYEPGDTEKTFPVNLYNQGEKAITDFKAVWYGASNVTPNPWDNPVWDAGLIELDKGESQTFDVTIPLPWSEDPNSDYSDGKIYFLCNIDGKTPASEINQENNMMVVRVATKLLPDYSII
ncbi:MAG TPA: hypothetical protein GXX58_05970, partial [Gelria sp.]|nr:hypothetical protein [Gelria sp.]